MVPGTGAPAIVPLLPGNAVISSLPQQAMIQLAQANATAAIVTSRVWGTDQPATASTPTKVNSSIVLFNENARVLRLRPLQ